MYSHTMLRSSDSFIALLCLVVVITSPTVLAEEIEVVEEIVVTARSTGESLETVPVSVAALSEEDIARYDASSILDITQMAPQLESYGGGEGTGGAFLIRGVGTTGDDAGLEQSVAINMDGVQLSRSRILFNSMYDVRQVEIIKGPQALFFGKNSPAGVISFHTVDPGEETDGYVKTGYEFESEEFYVEGAFGGALTDSLKARIAGRYSEMDGWTKNKAVARPDPFNPAVTLPGALQGSMGPDSESLGLRLTLLYEPNEWFRSNLKLSYGEYEDNDPLATAESICAPGVSLPVFVNAVTGGIVPDPAGDCSLNGRVAATAEPADYLVGAVNGRWERTGTPFTDLDTKLLSWRNSFEFENHLLELTTGFSELDRTARGQFNRLQFSGASGGAREEYRNWSQEVRLISQFDGPINYTLGAYYSDGENEQLVDLFFVFIGPDPQGNTVSSIKASKLEAESVSLFGQIRWNIGDEWELAAGLRWTDEEKETVQSNPYVHPIWALFGFSTPDRILRSNFEDDNVSPEATLSWYPNDDTTLYAAYKTGYKSGGTAVPAVLNATNTTGNLTFDSEEVEGAEIGYKGRLLDGDMRVDLTVYYYEYEGLQLATYDPVTLSYAIQNAADAEQYGVEGSLDYRVSDAWRLRAAFGFNSLEYDSFPDAPCYAYQTVAQGCVAPGVQDLSGESLHRAPDFSASFGSTYSMLVMDDLTLTFDIDARYTDSYNAAENQNPTAKQDSYWLINAGVRLAPTSANWEVALFGRNLDDERVMGFVQDRPNGGPGDITAYGLRPRSIVLEGVYRF